MKGIFVHIIELIYCLVELSLSFWDCALFRSSVSFEWVEFTVVGGLAIFRILQLNFIRVNSFMWLVELRWHSSIVVGVNCTTLTLSRLLHKEIATWIRLYRYWQLDLLILTLLNSCKDLRFVSSAANSRTWRWWELRALHEFHRRAQVT